jgi:glutamate transport system permease protein
VPAGAIRLLTVVFTVVFAAIAAVVVWKLDQKDQWAAQKWKPFLQADIWTRHIIPGVEGTLKAAAIAAVLAVAFGIILGIARVSDHWWIRVPAGTVVELFRAIPLLLLIFFASYVPGALTNFTWNPAALQAVVFGLTMYHGSVLAEVVRAGINAIPKGQSEAGYAVGLRKGQLMRLILVPDLTFGWIATQLELRNRRRGRTTARPAVVGTTIEAETCGEVTTAADKV